MNMQTRYELRKLEDEYGADIENDIDPRAA